MTTPRYDIIGQALGDTSRARMLCELMEGRAFTNKELACAAGISPPTATAHLRLLQQAGLVVAEKSGRCVYHRIAGAEVAQMLEQLATIAPAQTLYHAQRRKAGDLAIARSCYDHLAGPLAVALTDRMLHLGLLHADNGGFRVSPSPLWDQLGVTLPTRAGPRVFARPCLDWTERKPHIAGAMGQQILDHGFAKAWVKRHQHKRGLRLTPAGCAAFHQILDFDPSQLEQELVHG